MKTIPYIGLVLAGLALANPAAAQFSCTTNVDNTITITGYTGPGGAVTIPTAINGLSVTAIGDFAFWGLTNVSNVTIPDSVVSLGSDAFEGCLALTNVAIGSGVTNICCFAFDGSGLTSVTIPNSVVSIEDYAFLNCSSLTNVTIPDSVTRIIGYAFSDCYSLPSVTIPSSVSVLGGSAFSDCYQLTSVFFTGNAPGVEPTAFENSDSATVYYLPGTSGWTGTFDKRPTMPWALPYPVMLTGSPGFGVLSNGFGFTISWLTNASVVVEACTNLSAPVWTRVSTNTQTLSSGVSYFTDPLWTNHPVRFYRLTSPH
jgi:hypothetical protein